MNWIKPPVFLRLFYGSDVIWSIPSKEKTIFLTFDDGIEPEVTPKILNILESYNAKATFFIVGDSVKRNPEIFQQLLSSGHMIGNHTFNHLNGWNTNTAEYVKNVKLADELLITKLFRPPYGRMKLQQVKRLKKEYKIIMWSVLSYDFHSGISKEQCLDNVIKHTGRGSIVVFHDSLKAKEKILYVLPRILDYFTELGYQFESIPVH